MGKNQLLRALLAGIAAVSVFHSPASRAELGKLNCSREIPACFLRITGSISQDDARAALRIPALVPAAKTILTVVLDSDGGDPHAAMSVGRVLRSLEATVAVGRNDSCVSACVLLLAAGTIRAALGRVGIHRPLTTGSARGDPESLQRTQRQVDNSIRAYLREMTMPENLYDAMLQISPEHVRFLSDAELHAYSLNASDPVSEYLINARWASAYGLTRQEFLRRDARVTRECSAYGDGSTRWYECREAIFRADR